MSSSSFPQKNFTTKIIFPENKVVCALRLAVKGRTLSEATDEEKLTSSDDNCEHVIWPTIFPQCIGCLASNKHQRYIKDSKGREHKVIR